MRSPVSLKQEFFKKWMTALQVCNSSDKNLSIMERKKAIKLSADIAMASVRQGSSCWSRALIANAFRDNKNKVLVQQILGPQGDKLQNKMSLPSNKICNKIVRCKKILKKCKTVKKVMPKNHRVSARSVAKKLVKKRTQVLKNLVPGGEYMDEVSLIEETLDYIVSLRAQVDVMRCIATTSEQKDQN